MKTGRILALVLMLFLMATPVLAQESGLPKPGITPDSPFYFLDLWGEKLGMLLAFTAESKAKKALAYAEERLAEAQAMMEKGNSKAAEVALRNYERNVERAQERIEQAMAQGRDMTEVIAIVGEATAKHTEVLEGLLEKVPEQARKGIEKALEVSERGHNTALEKLEKIQSGEIPGNKEQATEALSKNKGGKGGPKEKGQEKRNFKEVEEPEAPAETKEVEKPEIPLEVPTSSNQGR